MATSLIQVLKEGGCYWKKQQYHSPGHSLAIPNGTHFKIAIESPQGNRFVSGTCRDGFFCIEDGPLKGRKFTSANGAVNEVREPSTNAFLHMNFNIDGKWIGADRLREMPAYQCDDVEEMALADAIEAIRAKLKKSGQKLEEPDLSRKAAEVVEKHPSFMATARQRKEAIEDLGDIEINL